MQVCQQLSKKYCSFFIDEKNCQPALIWLTYIFRWVQQEKVQMPIFFVIPHYVAQLPKKAAIKKQWLKNRLTAETAFIHFTDFEEKTTETPHNPLAQPVGRWFRTYITPCSIPLDYSRTWFSFPFTIHHAQLCWNEDAECWRVYFQRVKQSGVLVQILWEGQLRLKVTLHGWTLTRLLLSEKLHYSI